MTERRPTIQDVAEAAGVSRALVSIVFRDAVGASEATRERVRRIGAELGYRPDRRARLLRQSRTRTIGVSFGVREAFHGDLVEALYSAAGERDYSLALSATSSGRSEDEAVESLLDDRPEALVLLGSTLSDTALRELDDRIPVVVVARSAEGVVDSAHTDDRAGGRLATRHLRELGHRRIAHLHGGAAAGADARLAGFVDAVAGASTGGSAAGVESVVLEGGIDEESGIRAAVALLEAAGGEVDRLPTAVFAFNDRCAFGVLDTFLRRGVRVPEDVSVIGYDDSRLSRLTVVGLSTIAQDSAALAASAVDFAISAIDARATAADAAVGGAGSAAGASVDAARPAREAVLDPALVIRSTTAPPRS